MWYVVGGGPSGLTCAQLLAECGERVMLFEAQATLGGCHAVHRVDGLFTEHGPRICVENYVNFRAVLARFGDFEQMFVPYKASFLGSSIQLARGFSAWELACFAGAFVALLATGGSAMKRETVGEWMDRCGFGGPTRARINLLCATIEGTGADRMTLFELLDIVNQNLGYGIRQPRVANDRSLFERWSAHLVGLGCDLRIQERVLSIARDSNGAPLSVRTSRRCLSIGPNDHVVVALPPAQAARLLPEVYAVNALAVLSSYDVYLPITFHWTARIRTPSDWGGSRPTPWGMLFIVMSDYLEGEPTGTIVQAVVAFVDVRSPSTGKSAHETADVDELVDEAWRQLDLDLPRFDRAILSPRVSRRDGKWFNEDTAFLRTKDAPERMEFALAPRLSFVGTHNGENWYSATALETACSNAIAFVNRTVPRSRDVQVPVRAMDLRIVVLLLLIVGIVTASTIFLARGK